ncbi:MAG: Pyrroline-5-carboxylate reductase, partial [uncultured Phycisphaerae bacterium]
ELRTRHHRGGEHGRGDRAGRAGAGAAGAGADHRGRRVAGAARGVRVAARRQDDPGQPRRRPRHARRAAERQAAADGRRAGEPEGLVPPELARRVDRGGHQHRVRPAAPRRDGAATARDPRDAQHADARRRGDGRAGPRPPRDRRRRRRHPPPVRGRRRGDRGARGQDGRRDGGQRLGAGVLLLPRRAHGPGRRRDGPDARAGPPAGDEDRARRGPHHDHDARLPRRAAPQGHEPRRHDPRRHRSHGVAEPPAGDRRCPEGRGAARARTGRL